MEKLDTLQKMELIASWERDAKALNEKVKRLDTIKRCEWTLDDHLDRTAHFWVNTALIDMKKLIR